MNLFAIGGAVILATGALVIWMSVPPSRSGRVAEGLSVKRVGHFARSAVPSYLQARTRVATISDYETWLKTYLRRGGKIRRFRDEKMGGDWFVATENFYLPPLSGEDSISVIVPSDVTVNCDELGDNTLYHMKDGTVEGGGAELFADVHIEGTH